MTVFKDYLWDCLSNSSLAVRTIPIPAIASKTLCLETLIESLILCDAVLLLSSINDAMDFVTMDPDTLHEPEQEHADEDEGSGVTE